MGARDRRSVCALIATAAACCALLAIPAVAAADVITVDSAADPGVPGGTCTLHEAITVANLDNPGATGCDDGNGNDEIKFDPSVTPSITLTEALPTVNSNLTITGPGASLLDIQRSPTAPTKFRIFDGSSASVLAISGVTISDGKAEHVGAAVTQAVGAGIATSGDLTLTGVVVESNTVTSTASGSSGGVFATANGAGVSSNGGAGKSLTITGSVIRNNVATATATNTGLTAADDAQASINGAGLTSNVSSVTIERSTISGNTATATTTVSATSAEANAQVTGVGVNLQAPTVMGKVSSSTISGNTATMSASGGSPASSNTSYGSGALRVFGASGTILDRITVAGNTVGGATVAGGGIYVEGGATILSSTIAGNSAPAAPLSSSNLILSNDVGPYTLKNTIVANPAGAAANCNAGPTVAGDHNLEFPGSGCPYIGANPGDIQNMNPALGGLTLANGGPTATMALGAGSAAIDAGQSAVGETTDQRGAGFPRPFDFPGLTNAADGTDIGAFELQPACAAQATTTPATSCAPPDIPPTSATGQRAAALKKCKKKKGAKRKKCKKRALKLPV